jgi:hypothetical protein
VADKSITEREVHAVKLDIGKRQDFDRIEFSNAAGLTLALYKNGGTAGLLLDALMINQVEGRPLQGGLDRPVRRNAMLSLSPGLAHRSSIFAQPRNIIGVMAPELIPVHSGGQLVQIPQGRLRYLACIDGTRPFID